jgi:hypothetical protein
MTCQELFLSCQREFVSQLFCCIFLVSLCSHGLKANTGSLRLQYWSGAAAAVLGDSAKREPVTVTATGRAVPAASGAFFTFPCWLSS